MGGGGAESLGLQGVGDRQGVPTQSPKDPGAPVPSLGRGGQEMKPVEQKVKPPRWSSWKEGKGPYYTWSGRAEKKTGVGTGDRLRT